MNGTTSLPAKAAGRDVGIGVLGYGFMGRAHTFAYQRLALVAPELQIAPRLVAIAGRTADKVAAAATRFGYARHYTDWRELLQDDEVSVLDNCTVPYMHAEPSIAALEAGKHVICEKPLAPTLAEARAMRDAAARSVAKTMCGFNYRFLPAVRLARQLIDEGAIGRVYMFRAHYLQEGRHDPARPGFVGPEALGRGALAGLGSHVIDLARFLVGEPVAVSALLATKIRNRPHPRQPGETVAVADDDLFHCLVEFEGGATGILEASYVSAGRKNYFSWEINGAKGSLRFNLERLNELEVYLVGQPRPDAAGFERVLVTEPEHPFLSQWWPRGHVLGWEHTFVHELQHFLACVVTGRPVSPEGATFEDGYRAALVSEAICKSAAMGRRVPVAEAESEAEGPHLSPHHRSRGGRRQELRQKGDQLGAAADREAE